MVQFYFKTENRGMIEGRQHILRIKPYNLLLKNVVVCFRICAVQRLLFTVDFLLSEEVKIN